MYRPRGKSESAFTIYYTWNRTCWCSLSPRVVDVWVRYILGFYSLRFIIHWVVPDRWTFITPVGGTYWGLLSLGSYIMGFIIR